MVYLKLKGRKKKSGGPHAARGPYFGHVCSALDGKSL